jgi:ferredoxin
VSDIKVITSERAPSAEELARLADSHDSVIAVGRWISEWPRILDSLRRSGARWHRVVYIDEHDSEKAGLSLKEIVDAYKAYLEAADNYLPIVISDTGKVVSRRDLLRSGLGVFFVYTAMPEVTSERCASLKSCDLCLSSCPLSALDGKPPRVSEKNCVECGLCTSSCPSGFLYSPTHPPEAIRRLLYEFKARGVDKLVVTCSSNRGETYEREDLQGAILELPCIASMRIHEYLFARQLGLEITFFCPEEARKKCPKGKAAEEYLLLVAETQRVIRPSYQGEPIYTERLTELIAPLAVDKDDWVPLTRLMLFRLKANENLCTLCGACTKSCPTKALMLTREGNYELLFNHSGCIGCNACVRVCPESALSTEKAANPRLLYSRRTIKIAASPAAKCKKCGREIGPENMLKRLNEKMANAGISKEQRESIWLCEECKRETLLEEFKRELEA